MLKAVIMDFDGVIIDTEVVWYEIYKGWFKEHYGYDLSVTEFLICVGSSAKDFFLQMKEQNNIVVDEELFAKNTMNRFIAESDALPIKSGVRNFITEVKSRGLKLALATSSAGKKPIKHLKRLGLLDYFDEIITAEDVERIKPFPDLFLKAVERLNIEPSEAIIVEDSANGLKAGLKADINVIVVPNEVTKHSAFDDCYRIAERLDEVNVGQLIDYYQEEECC